MKLGKPYNGSSTVIGDKEIEGYFKCLSGEIISFLGLCDGYTDCNDSSDEDSCEKTLGKYWNFSTNK